MFFNRIFILTCAQLLGSVVAPYSSWKDFSQERVACNRGPCVPPSKGPQIAYSSDDDCARRLEEFVQNYNGNEVCNLKVPSSKTAMDAALSWNAKKIPGSDSQVTLKDEHGNDHVFPTFSSQHRCDVIYNVGYCSKTFLKQQFVGIYETKCPTHMVNSLPKASSSQEQKSECKYPDIPKVDKNAKGKGSSSSGGKMYCKDEGRSGW